MSIKDTTSIFDGSDDESDTSDLDLACVDVQKLPSTGLSIEWEQ